ncbi:Non-heme dioxygenase N-terminal domain containing protein [Trema orientale]|uniref:Non-heme dioxygenase N-terminal domain containing protein n=1 Tax=Trema orientale TaxID=63057 RepID=A0A2P5FUP4_TREOI|nr:Non-heme dioxygenase N-terminal domain containing protein [Trema orientale]
MASALPLPDSLNVTDFVVNQGNGVKGLADLGIESVPRQYIQPPHERFDFDSTKTKTQDSIPIIDFSKWDDPEVSQAICEAAAKWGFFQIVNHGVPIEVLEDLKAAVHRFFELPAPEKRKYLRDSPSATVRLATSFSPKAEQVLEWKDYLTMLYDSEDDASASWPPECSFLDLECIG